MPETIEIRSRNRLTPTLTLVPEQRQILLRIDDEDLPEWWADAIITVDWLPSDEWQRIVEDNIQLRQQVLQAVNWIDSRAAAIESNGRLSEEEARRFVANASVVVKSLRETVSRVIPTPANERDKS